MDIRNKNFRCQCPLSKPVFSGNFPVGSLCVFLYGITRIFVSMVNNPCHKRSVYVQFLGEPCNKPDIAVMFVKSCQQVDTNMTTWNKQRETTS